MLVKGFWPFWGLDVWNQRLGRIKYSLNSCDCNIGRGRVGSIDGAFLLISERVFHSGLRFSCPIFPIIDVPIGLRWACGGQRPQRWQWRQGWPAPGPRGYIRALCGVIVVFVRRQSDLPAFVYDVFMRSIVVLFLALPLLAQTPGTAITPKKKIALFNGKNLDGWYTWLQENKYQDPKHVFTVEDRAIRVSGEKWGGPNHGKREGRARDSGILVHGVGEDGAHDGIWLQSIESQVIEGGTGDFIMVNGRERPTMTAKVREFNGQFYWDENGAPKTLERGRFDWFGRDPNWKDQLGYRGRKDIEKPVGEWYRQEVVADRDTITNIVNGVVVNKGYRVYPTAGKVQLQSEGAEIYYRRVEMIPVE